ncbi:MAG: GEVED domain-containing protein [Ferruginibacter sp.]
MKLFYQTGKTAVFSTLLLLFICFGTKTMSQTTLTTTFANNNGFSLVTFNFTNNNAGAVIITEIASVAGISGPMGVAAYYKASAIAGAPGTIDPGNGWNQFGSATITAIANTTTSIPQQFMTGLSLIVPAGATYGIAVQADALQYSTLTAGTYTTVGGGAVITTGTNIGFAGDVAPNAPTFTPRGFIGSITFSGASPCTGTPAPGATLSTANPVCAGINFTLSTQNSTPGSGVGYQWQSSPDGMAWTNIAGATNSNYSTSQTVATYYQANVTCGTVTVASTPLQVTMNPPLTCYCVAGSPDVDFEKIGLVEYGTISNPSTSVGPYEDFTAISTTIEKQNPTPITVTIDNPFNTDQVIVFIDYNHNGSFADAGETAYTSALGVGPHTGTITIPPSALLGPTRLRIRLHDTGFGPNSTSCGNSTYGQVEDYTVDIVPCTQGTISQQPVDVTTNCSGNASFSVTATGTGLVYEWQERVNSSSPWTIVTNGGIYSGATTATLTLSDVTSAINGHQFKVAIGGGCTPQFLSDVATLTVGPLVANVTPASATTCSGSLQALFISTTAPPTTQTFSSGPIAVPIPDNTPTGGSSVIAVNAIPAGAIITGIKVKFTMAHTYSGDVAVVLKAPNGNILNLDYFISSTGAAGAGFVNTVISSQTLPPLPYLGSSSSPYTGSFAPDAVLTIIPGNPPAGPTGFIPNVDNFPALYSIGNGDWTFAAYDAFNLDAGLLTDWSIDITYGAPFSGVWSPAAGLFTDAAGTIPYVAGTSVNTVYASPTVSTDYSVTISTATCGTATTIVPVTVGTAISGAITGASNQMGCTNGTATFTAGAAVGGPITYQWQESVDGGGSWTDIVDGGIYSGATTATLTLTGVPATYNSYQYRAILSVAACSSTVTSAVGILTVNPAPDVQIQAGPTTQIYPGITSTITAAVSPSAASSYQWYQNGVAVPGAVASTIVVDVDHLGEYTVSVIDVNGCESTSSSISITAASNASAFIYPSPNTGQFQVRYYAAPGNQIPRSVTIYDSKGARVFTRSYNNTEPYSRMDVDMTHYNKGIYRVELSDRNGRRIKTGSVIIL